MKNKILRGIVLAGCVGIMLPNSVLAEAPVTLPEVVVYGRRANSIYIGENVVRENSLGILGSTDFMDIPFNALTLSKKSLDAQRSAGNSLVEAVTLDPTVMSNGDNTFNDVTIRGFSVRSQFFYLNGVPGMLSPSSIPTNMTDRIEIISGPSTLLTGIGYTPSMGGAINLVPKVAGEGQRMVLMEMFSGKNHFTQEVDLGTRWGNKREWGVRLNASTANGKTRFHNEKMREGNAFVNLDYHSERTKMQVLFGRRSVHHKGYQSGIRLNGNDLPLPPRGDSNFQIPWAEYRHTNDIIVFSLEHRLADSIEAFLKAGRATDNWNPLIGVYFPVLKDAQGNFTTNPLEALREGNVFRAYSGGIRWNRNLNKLRHEAVISVDQLRTKGWIQYDKRMFTGVGPTYSGNIYDLHTLDSAVVDYPSVWTDAMDNGTNTMTGWSVLDRMVTADERWSFLLGVRHQKVQAGTAVSQKFSPNYGVMYTVNPQIKVYANYLQSLGRGWTVPRNRGYVNAGEYLPPQTTEQYEAGLKWDTGRLAGSVSVFSVEQENRGVDPLTKVYGYYGRQKNRGIQITAFGEVAPKWTVIGGVMYMDSKQHGGNDNGQRIVGLPHWNFTLASEYALTKSFSLTGRLLMQDAAPLDRKGLRKAKGWWRLDLGAQYRKKLENEGVLHIGLNIRNVLNRKYWLVRDAVDEAVILEGPRAVTLVASYEI